MSVSSGAPAQQEGVARLGLRCRGRGCAGESAEAAAVPEASVKMRARVPMGRCMAGCLCGDARQGACAEMHGRVPVRRCMAGCLCGDARQGACTEARTTNCVHAWQLMVVLLPGSHNASQMRPCSDNS
eukprot:1145112-Pelagomonas_calceolata.AAC.9